MAPDSFDWVRDPPAQGGSFTALPRLNAAGVCVLVVAGVEMDLWQIRQKALGDLFFGSPPE